MMRVDMNLAGRIRPVAVVLALAIAAPAAAQAVRAGKTASGAHRPVRSSFAFPAADIC
jgi:hypothetical protein